MYGFHDSNILTIKQHLSQFISQYHILGNIGVKLWPSQGPVGPLALFVQWGPRAIWPSPRLETLFKLFFAL